VAELLTNLMKRMYLHNYPRGYYPRKIFSLSLSLSTCREFNNTYFRRLWYPLIFVTVIFGNICWRHNNTSHSFDISYFLFDYKDVPLFIIVELQCIMIIFACNSILNELLSQYKDAITIDLRRMINDAPLLLAYYAQSAVS